MIKLKKKRKKRGWIYGYIYHFAFVYNINDTGNIINIHKYLMKNTYKIMPIAIPNVCS